MLDVRVGYDLEDSSHSMDFYLISPLVSRRVLERCSMSVQMYVFIGLFVLLLLLLLLIWSLFIFTIIHCLLTEKDHTKKIFWLFAILIAGGVGSLLYLFLRLPRRRREAREPGYRSEFEEKILRAISRRKVPSRKALLRKRRSRRAMFAVMHTVFVSLL